MKQQTVITIKNASGRNISAVVYYPGWMRFLLKFLWKFIDICVLRDADRMVVEFPIPKFSPKPFKPLVKIGDLK